MKLSDVDDKINEDIGDWLAKTGIQGQAKKLGAQQKAAEERVFKVGFEYFKNQLTQSLQSGIKSGFIQTPKKQAANTSNAAVSTVNTASVNTSANVRVQPGKRIVIPKNGAVQYYKLSNGKWYNANNQQIVGNNAIQNLEQRADKPGNAREENITEPGKQNTTESNSRFKLLTQLVENKILNEQETVSGFIQDYVASQTDSFSDNPKYEDFINRLSNTAQTEYATDGKISDKTYEQLWSTIFNWSKLSRSRSRRTSQGNTTNIKTDTNNNGVVDTRDRLEWHDELSRQLDTLDPNKSADVKKIGEIGAQLLKFAQTSKKT